MAKYGYARVSTVRQEKEGFSLERQEEILKDSGAVTVVTETYTGTKESRPKLDKLLAKMSAGDTLIVTSIDRLSRTLLQGLQLIEGLIERGIVVHVLNIGVLDDSLDRKMIRNVMLMFAEYNRDVLVKNMRDGKEKARTKPGYREGRPKKYTETQLNHAISLLSGQSYSMVSEMTGISKSTLNREAKRRKLTD